MKVVIYLIIAAILFIAYVRYLETASIFYPTRGIAATPRELGLPFEDVYLSTQDKVTIHGWFIPAPGAKSTFLFFHGNAGNIGDRLQKISDFHQMGLNVLIIDYRGYGKSEGTPSEAGLYKDALAAYDYLHNSKGIAPKHMIAYGASLGGAVAVDLAAKRELAALIIDSAFSSAAAMAKRIYPFVPSFLIQTKLDSLTKIRNLTIPKLFIHSRDDEIVPFRLGQELYEAAAGQKEFLVISGTHNEGYVQDQEKVTRGITNFLKNHNLL